MKRIAPGADRRLPALDLPRPPAPLPLRADLLGLRGRVDRALRRRPRPAPRRLAPAALQPLQPRRLRPGPGPLHAAGRARSIPADYHGEAQLVMLPAANILQPLIDIANAVLQFFHDNVGLSWGISIIALTVVHPGAADPAHLQTAERDAGAAGAAAADQRDPGEIQKRQTAHAAGNDALLQREQSQPVCLLHPADRPAAGLHHPLLRPAARPPRRHRGQTRSLRRIRGHQGHAAGSSAKASSSSTT